MGFFGYLSQHLGTQLHYFGRHFELIAITLAIGSLIGVIVGIAVYQTNLPLRFALKVATVLLTIPSLAAFGVLVATPIPLVIDAYIPLVAYSLLPIINNTVTGLQGVNSSVIESAKGIGMGRWRRLFSIELPLAWPVILAGVRIATLVDVGIAAIAAYVGAPGLGQDIVKGTNNIGVPFALWVTLYGVFGITIVGLILDLLLYGVGKLTTSRGLSTKRRLSV
jgi:osmoprotectant transport system permease protein